MINYYYLYCILSNNITSQKSKCIKSKKNLNNYSNKELTHFYNIIISILDGLIGEHYLLEIKCPYSARDSNNAIEAVNF